MERAQENEENINLLLRVNGARGDLQQRFVDRGFDEEDDEIELSLGLSSNGRFGVDPTRKKPKRSSSISNLDSAVDAASDNGGFHQPLAAGFESYAPPLTRTCSLPTEAAGESRRDVQSMRRMEARKKRMEKLKNVRVVKDKENCLESDSGDLQRICNENCEGFENGRGMEGSIGSRGSASSGVSETRTQHINGAKRNTEVKSPSSIQSSPAVQMEQKPGDMRTTSGAKEVLKNAMLEMPYVSTKWDGINGNKVDGFLYGFKKAEEVKILCICHGLFLSPAEFVKHGGGGDVDNPLKHIVVNPYPLL